jgi:hypothetical protein
MSSSTTEFYTVIEMRIFMDSSWNLIREMTYLALASEAFDVLVEHANFKLKHPGIQAIRAAGRPCGSRTFIEAMNCLQSGSPSQLVAAAISCTSFALYSIPERK